MKHFLILFQKDIRSLREEYLVLLFVSVVILVAIALALRSIRQRDHDKEIQLIWFLIIFSVSCAAFSSILRLTLDKYAAEAIPALVLLVAIGLGTRGAPRVVRVGLFTAVILGSAVVTLKLVRMPNTTYGEAAAIIERHEQPGDRILVVPFNDDIAVRPYYHGTLPIDGFFPAEDPGTATMKDNIQNNFKSVVTKDSVGQLAKYVGDAQRVWVLFDIPPTAGFWNGNLIDSWFKNSGYSSTVYRASFHNVPPLLVEYIRTVR